MADEVTEELYGMILRLGVDGEMEKTVMALRKNYANLKLSQDDVHLRLFSKYKDLCKQMDERVDLLPTIPSALLEVNDNDLTGWKALRTNVFWLRLLGVIFSFISFCSLASTNIVDNIDYRPQHFFEHCSIYAHGTFPTASYKGLLAVGIIDYVYSLFCVMFYLLPLDENGKKYVPGLNRCCLQLGPGPIVQQLFQRILNFFQEHGFVFSVLPSPRVLSCCESFLCGVYGTLIFLLTSADVILLSLSTFFCVYSSIIMQQPVYYSWSWNSVSNDAYLTLGTFYKTFSTTNSFSNSAINPVPLLSVSISFMYLTITVLAANAWISYRYWMQRRPLAGSAHSDSSAKEIAGTDSGPERIADSNDSEIKENVN